MTAAPPTPPRERAGLRPRLELTALLAGALLALAPLRITFAERDERFEELALGAETTSIFARVDGAPIHCQDLTDASECLSGHARRGGRPVVLWLGNSQLHAINQLAPGEEGAAPILFRRLAARGLDLLAFSQPNANLQEHLVLFAYLRTRLPIRQLLLPVVFDDLREIGVRAGIAPGLTDPASIALLERGEPGRKLLARHGRSGSDDLAGLRETVQEASERALDGWLEQHSRLWALRPQARGALFSQLYLLRNSLLGITAQSKRRMIPGRVALNLAAAEALLELSREAGIPSLIYVVPLRSDAESPYDAAEYAAFKRDLAALAGAAGADFADLEALVPPGLWGRKASTSLEAGAELDFMHFRAGGHRLLADALGERLEARLAEAGR